MKETIRITTLKFDSCLTDFEAFNKLSPNAKKAYQLFTAIANTNSKQLLSFNINELSNNINLAPSEFTAALKELSNQEYFMYYNKNSDAYVFGTSRMVY